jgi:hypothetical protein
MPQGQRVRLIEFQPEDPGVADAVKPRLDQPPPISIPSEIR